MDIVTKNDRIFEFRVFGVLFCYLVFTFFLVSCVLELNLSDVIEIEKLWKKVRVEAELGSRPSYLWLWSRDKDRLVLSW